MPNYGCKNCGFELILPIHSSNCLSAYFPLIGPTLAYIKVSNVCNVHCGAHRYMLLYQKNIAAKFVDTTTQHS